VAILRRSFALQTMLLAATAVAALVGAALIAVPTEGEATRACVDLGTCLSF
jgi:hypothetical protein